MGGPRPTVMWAWPGQALEALVVWAAARSVATGEGDACGGMAPRFLGPGDS